MYQAVSLIPLMQFCAYASILFSCDGVTFFGFVWNMLARYVLLHSVALCVVFPGYWVLEEHFCWLRSMFFLVESVSSGMYLLPAHVYFP